MAGSGLASSGERVEHRSRLRSPWLSSSCRTTTGPISVSGRRSDCDLLLRRLRPGPWTTGAEGSAPSSTTLPGPEDTVSVNQAGYVEKDGNEEPPVSERVATVTNGSTTLKEFQFDRAGALAVSFEDPSHQNGGQRRRVPGLQHKYDSSVIQDISESSEIGHPRSNHNLAQKPLFPFLQGAYSGLCRHSCPACTSRPKTARPAIRCHRHPVSSCCPERALHSKCQCRQSPSR